MMKLADMLDLGSSEETLEGSSPSIRSSLCLAQDNVFISKINFGYFKFH